MLKANFRSVSAIVILVLFAFNYLAPLSPLLAEALAPAETETTKSKVTQIEAPEAPEPKAVEETNRAGRISEEAAATDIPSETQVVVEDTTPMLESQDALPEIQIAEEQVTNNNIQAATDSGALEVVIAPNIAKYSNIVTGVDYQSQAFGEAAVRFSKLPATDLKLTIKKVEVSSEIEGKTVTSPAYEFTTEPELIPGSFIAEIKLKQLNVNEKAEVKYSEDGVNFLTEEVQPGNTDYVRFEVNHFTIFVLVNGGANGTVVPASCVGAIGTINTITITGADNCYNSIQAAINFASANPGPHIINVGAGTYTENLVINNSANLIGLQIVGSGMAATNIIGNIQVNGGTSTKDLTFKDFALTYNPLVSSGRGINLGGQMETIEILRLRVLNFPTFGISIDNNATVVGLRITYSELINNTVGLKSASTAKITNRVGVMGQTDIFYGMNFLNNIVDGDNRAGSSGIYAAGEETFVPSFGEGKFNSAGIFNSTFRNFTAHGIYAENFTNGSIYNNTFNNMPVGIKLWKGWNNGDPIDKVRIDTNTFTGNAASVDFIQVGGVDQSLANTGATGGIRSLSFISNNFTGANRAAVNFGGIGAGGNTAFMQAISVININGNDYGFFQNSFTSNAQDIIYNIPQFNMNAKTTVRWSAGFANVPANWDAIESDIQHDCVTSPFFHGACNGDDFVTALGSVDYIIPTGNIQIRKYICTNDVSEDDINSASGQQRPDANGNMTALPGCVLSTNKDYRFGYIQQTGVTGTEAPYNGLNDTNISPNFTDAGFTTAGILTISGLDTAGRYNLAEFSQAGERSSETEVLGFLCSSDNGLATNNYEITVVPAGGTAYCAVFDKQMITEYDSVGVCNEGTSPVFQGSYPISSTDIDGTNIPVTANTQYVFKALGTYNFDSAIPGKLGDAYYATFDGWTSESDILGGAPGKTFRGVMTLLSDMGTSNVGIVNWGGYSATHTYEFGYTPISNSVQFLVSDWYDDWYNSIGYEGNDYNNQLGMNNNVDTQGNALRVEAYMCLTQPASPIFWVEEDTTQVELNWLPVDNATSYKVYRATTNLGAPSNADYSYPATPVATTAGNTIVVAHANGVTARYIVVASNEDFDSTFAPSTGKLAKTFDYVIDDSAMVSDFNSTGSFSSTGAWGSYGTDAPATNVVSDILQNAVGGDNFGSGQSYAGETATWTKNATGFTAGIYEVLVSYICDSSRGVALYDIYSGASRVNAANIAIDQATSTGIVGDASCGSQANTSVAGPLWVSLGAFAMNAASAEVRLVGANTSGSSESDRYILADAVAIRRVGNTNYLFNKTAADINGGDLLVGDNVQYTVSLENTSAVDLGTGSLTGVDLLGVQISDLIPANTTYVSGSISASCASGIAATSLDDSTSTLTANFAVVKYTEIACLQFNVTVNNGTANSTTISNTATVAIVNAAAGQSTANLVMGTRLPQIALNNFTIQEGRLDQVNSGANANLICNANGAPGNPCQNLIWEAQIPGGAWKIIQNTPGTGTLNLVTNPTDNSNAAAQNYVLTDSINGSSVNGFFNDDPINPNVRVSFAAYAVSDSANVTITNDLAIVSLRATAGGNSVSHTTGGAIPTLNVTAGQQVTFSGSYTDLAGDFDKGPGWQARMNYGATGFFGQTIAGPVNNINYTVTIQPRFYANGTYNTILRICEENNLYGFCNTANVTLNVTGGTSGNTDNNGQSLPNGTVGTSGQQQGDILGIGDIGEFNIDLPVDFNVQPGQSTVFTVSSNGLGLDQLTCSWDFGDGSLILETTGVENGRLNHTYQNPGSYTLRVTCKDAQGKTVSDTSSVLVGPKAAQDNQTNGNIQGEANNSQNSQNNAGFNLGAFISANLLLCCIILLVLAAIVGLLVYISRRNRNR